MRAYVAALAFIAAIATPGVAAARQVTQDLLAASSRLQPGADVIVRDDDNRSIRGRVRDLSRDGITVVVAGAPVTILAPRIWTITRAYRDPRWTGAAVGLAIGGGLGVAAARSLRHEYRNDIGTAEAAGIALEFGLAGAGLGFLVDALVPGRQLIYNRAPTLSVVPAGRQGAAVVATMRF